MKQVRGIIGRWRWAKDKAEWLIEMLQGSSALEGQAVGPEAEAKMVRKTFRELFWRSLFQLRFDVEGTRYEGR